MSDPHKRIIYALLCIIPGVSPCFPQERLELELIPVWVVNAELEASADAGAVYRALATVHGSMATLGVQPDEYNVTLSDRSEVLECNRVSVLEPVTSCRHKRIGEVSGTGWHSLVKDLYPAPAKRDYQLLVLLLPDAWPWVDVSGWSVLWQVPGTSHWTESACRAWGMLNPIVIAHELGHCFGLVHNEIDAEDYGVDLMLAKPVYTDWLKPSNAEKVRYWFRDEVRPHLPSARLMEFIP